MPKKFAKLKITLVKPLGGWCNSIIFFIFIAESNKLDKTLLDMIIDSLSIFFKMKKA